MRKINTQAIEETVYALALKAGVNITPSCLNAMKSAYEKETGEVINAVHFKDAEGFLTGYKPIFDVVFMDIMLGSALTS